MKRNSYIFLFMTAPLRSASSGSMAPYIRPDTRNMCCQSDMNWLNKLTKLCLTFEWSSMASEL